MAIDYEGVANVAKICVAELVGTAFLALLTCLGSIDSDSPLVERALVYGFTVATVIQGIGHISGAHLNPSVTVASVITGALPVSIAPFYIVPQFIGGAIGSMIFPQLSHIYPLPPTACVALPHPDISALQAVLIELTITSSLILVCCGTWDPKNPATGEANSIKFGIVITMVKLVAMPLTGASLNPATALGPALWNNYWDYHWIYWVGPLSGSVLTSSLYRVIFGLPVVKDIPK